MRILRTTSRGLFGTSWAKRLVDCRTSHHPSSLQHGPAACLASQSDGLLLVAEQGTVIPAPPKEKLLLWTDHGFPNAPVDMRRRIFCNRSLNMSQVKAVGFDMDYTLAQYKPETFETMAHRETARKLVSKFNYPAELCDKPFDWRYMMRGLIIDKHRGNMLKVDRHKYVKLAYHGFRKLSREERQATYECGNRDSLDEPDYGMIDTLFSLAEAYLFMQLVEMKDADPSRLPAKKTYAQLYKDVRTACDLCHRDGSLKRAVAENPGHYIHEDPHLLHILKAFRASGRKLFLATNSLWDYTHVVMNFLLAGRVGKDRNDEWLTHFDAVLVGCGKPKFFSAGQPLFAINTADGSLYNTDDGAPIIPIGEEDLPSPWLSSSVEPLAEHRSGQKAKVFQGGSVIDLHKMLGVHSGSEVVYVGDHIYGDILKSKKTLGWRTMLVVPELEAELWNLDAVQRVEEELEELRDEREYLDNQILQLELALRRAVAGGTGNGHGPALSAESQLSRELLMELQEQRADIKARHSALLHRYHESFHPVWGRLLKTGYQNSQFAHQVERFACLYTSHVSNLAFYSVDHRYRARRDQMAHEQGAGCKGDRTA